MEDFYRKKLRRKLVQQNYTNRKEIARTISERWKQFDSDKFSQEYIKLHRKLRIQKQVYSKQMKQFNQLGYWFDERLNCQIYPDPFYIACKP